MSYDLYNDLFYYLKFDDAAPPLRNRGYAIQYGSLQGTAILDAAGKYGKALRAQAAATDFGEWAVAYAYVPKELMAVSAWVWLDVLPSAMFGAYPKIIGSYSNDGIDYGIFLGSLSGDDISFRVVDEATSPYTANYTETVTGAWIHYVGISDPDNVWLYRNGTLVDSAVRSGSMGRNLAGTLQIGKNWQGKVDEFAWWGRLLSTAAPDEITESQSEFEVPQQDAIDAAAYGEAYYDNQYAATDAPIPLDSWEPQQPWVALSFDGLDTGVTPDRFPLNTMRQEADGSRDAVNYGATLVDAHVRTGVSFDGASHIDTRFVPSLDEDLSMGLWVYIPSAQAGNSFTLFGVDNSSGHLTNGFWYVAHEAGTLRFYTWGGSGSAAEYAMQGADYDRWVHIGAVAEWVPQEARLYVDGVLQDTGGYEVVPENGTWPVFIGGVNYRGALYAPGVFMADEFRVYRRALTGNEVVQLAVATNSPDWYAISLNFDTTNIAPIKDSYSLSDVGSPYAVTYSPVTPAPEITALTVNANKTFKLDATISPHDFYVATSYWEIEVEPDEVYLYYGREFPLDLSAGAEISDTFAVPVGYNLNGTRARLVVERWDDRATRYVSDWILLGSNNPDDWNPNLDNRGCGLSVDPLPPGRVIPPPLRPTRELPGPSILRRSERDFS